MRGASRIREAIKQTNLAIEEINNADAIPALEEGLDCLEEAQEHFGGTEDE